MLRGSTEILNTVCQELGGISPGQTTKDGNFTVIEVECQGACSNAPMMVIGDDFYVCLDLTSLLRWIYNPRRRIWHQKQPRKSSKLFPGGKNPSLDRKVVAILARTRRAWRRWLRRWDRLIIPYFEIPWIFPLWPALWARGVLFTWISVGIICTRYSFSCPSWAFFGCQCSKHNDTARGSIVVSSSLPWFPRAKDQYHYHPCQTINHI